MGSLKGRNSKWCLAVEDHNNVHEGTKLQLYECSHPVGQTFQVEKNKDGSMNLRYGNTEFCVDALGGTKFTNHGSYFGLYPCRTNGFNQELTHNKIGTLELTEFPPRARTSSARPAPATAASSTSSSCGTSRGPRPRRRRRRRLRTRAASRAKKTRTVKGTAVSSGTRALLAAPAAPVTVPSGTRREATHAS